MKLVDFSYHELNWRIEDRIPLQTVNLFVGKNAVGKSKTIRALSNIVTYFILQKEPNQEKDFGAFLHFEDQNESFVYSFCCSEGKITSEILDVNNNNKLIDRTKERSLLHGNPVNPPSGKLILHVRRDTVQYPYIEKIMLWAEHACGLVFNEMDIAGDYSTYPYMLGQRMDLYTMVKTLLPEELNHIINQAKILGYPLKEISTLEWEDNFRKVIFKEENVKAVLFDRSVSKGMFRAIYLLIYMEYLSSKERSSLLLIDDFCEGLDYDRSTKLGKLVFDFCLKYDIQLIAASNDTYLMDVVDLDYWNILQRHGSSITSINAKDNPELFHSFRFTGLSNFDFFSSDYIARHINQTNE